MENRSRSGKLKLISGILSFSWAELKTMNVAKLKSLYKISVGFLLMKMFGKKKKEAQVNKVEKIDSKKEQRERELRELPYRLSA